MHLDRTILKANLPTSPISPPGETNTGHRFLQFRRMVITKALSPFSPGAYVLNKMLLTPVEIVEIALFMNNPPPIFRKYGSVVYTPRRIWRSGEASRLRSTNFASL